MSRILIVDDEKGIRVPLRAFLVGGGYEVEVAENATEAQALLSNGDWDVVVSDVILPGVSGVELLKTIRRAAPHAQVIMMTGEPTAETAAEALRAGACDYLSKPVVKDAILRAVGNAVKIKTREDERRKLERDNACTREALEAEVMALKAEVERRKHAEQAMHAFVSRMSHKLRTPLTIAKESLGQLADGAAGTLTADQRRILDSAGRNLDHLTERLDDLLEFARVGSE